MDVEGFAPFIVLAAKAGHGTVLKTTQCDSDDGTETFGKSKYGFPQDFDLCALTVHQPLLPLSPPQS